MALSPHITHYVYLEFGFNLISLIFLKLKRFLRIPLVLAVKCYVESKCYTTRVLGENKITALKKKNISPFKPAIFCTIVKHWQSKSSCAPGLFACLR